MGKCANTRLATEEGAAMITNSTARHMPVWALLFCTLLCAHAAHAKANGIYLTLGLGYEPQNYFSRISRQGNPVSVIRAGWCKAMFCVDLEHHSSAILGGAQSERETDTGALLLRYDANRFTVEAGAAIDRNERLGGRYDAIGRIRYQLFSRYYVDYEHIQGNDAHINLFSIVATWFPFARSQN